MVFYPISAGFLYFFFFCIKWAAETKLVDTLDLDRNKDPWESWLNDFDQEGRLRSKIVLYQVHVFDCNTKAEKEPLLPPGFITHRGSHCC